MSLMQFSGLLVVWLLSTLFIATLTWFEFRRVRFNFNVFFSLLFLLTFFFGFPLTSIWCSALMWQWLRRRSCCRPCCQQPVSMPSTT